MSYKKTYWSENIFLITKCLSIWFIVSYCFSIILVEYLNTIRIGGYKLGFWVRNVRVGKIKVTNENKLILDGLNFLWNLGDQPYHMK